MLSAFILGLRQHEIYGVSGVKL